MGRSTAGHHVPGSPDAGVATAGARGRPVTAVSAAGVPFGERLTDLAEQRGDATALIFARERGDEERVSWRELEGRANQMARRLAQAGVVDGDTILVALGSTPEQGAVTFGAWKIGASVLGLRADRPAWEHERLRGLRPCPSGGG